MDAAIFITALLTLIVAFLCFLSTVTNIFKSKIPIQLGFFINSEIVSELELKTGDPNKKIKFRIHNLKEVTLSGVEIELCLSKPLSLSGSQEAIVYPHKEHKPISLIFFHGRLQDDKGYYLFWSDLIFMGHDNVDFEIELNTEGIHLGRYNIDVTINTTQNDFKYKKSVLYIDMK